MAGRTPHRALASALLLLVAAVAVAGCSGTIVNTDEARPTTQTSTTAPPPLPNRPTNDALANAFDYASPQPNGDSAYYFTSPSKRWVCAIIPRAEAGCQASTGSGIPVKDAPDAVANADGTEEAPNAIRVGRAAEPEFAVLDSPGYSLVPGPAAILPFGKVLIVAGFRCNVQEATGISCASEFTGNGFTFSADGYTMQYTDLPA
ncbi:hypothetical protein TUM20985_36790 [Mycobacterium antarcticum]|uniref:hypothetical protein n=1 Tax=unclassified Mycolicibacterium TaxID=2636767 RepID=UPI002394D626|nr:MULTISPECIES: hypothetical protein [unclassified Mycolicibacterium]BDX33132.1 hypothetical protein TUM20985_36790 [Mycolicibacterium sp. TUM20985]GLP76306.1 hypothetical protein TUM20983_34160 [Mycolicibacterium sp. TUM20983]GLP83314.1 hypothetical protein TUM20984_47340 [Mycolicibacterium sp. TUM20984]